MKVGAGLIIVLGAIGLATVGNAAVQITTCGGTIPADERWILQNDVVCQYRCSGDPSIVCGYNGDDLCGRRKGVCEPEEFVLERGAVLDLNGHTIEVAYQAGGAQCGTSDADVGRCTVKGPGAFVGNKGTPVWSRRMDLVVKNVTIGYSDSAIFTHGRLLANGLVILNDRENSIYAETGITLKNAHLDGESGVSSHGDVRLENVEIGPHGSGVATDGEIRGRDVQIDGHGTLSARDIALRRVTTTPDPNVDRAPLLSASRRLRLVDANVDAIESGKEPVLVRTTCETSAVYGSLASWGVCSDD
jgi:hypothetical protein